MKKAINKTNLIVALLFAFIACLTGATMLSLSANAQEEQPKSTVEFTSYTSVLGIGEEFEFAALVTNEDDTTSTEVEWSSSNYDVLDIDETGLALALDAGNATITATAPDGAFASIDVLVSDEAIRVNSIEVYPEVLELGVGWTTRMSYTILPDDAYEQRATWASDDPSVISIDQNGNVEAMKAGTATITVTSIDNQKTATCTVVVYEDLVEATLTPDTLVTTIGQVENNTMELMAPDEVTFVDESYHWYSMDDSIASIDPNADKIGTIYSWNFGTTTIYAVAHGSDGNVYAAMGTVHVTASYFYITGLYSDLDDPEGDPWVTYNTAEAAEAAGVLLGQSATEPYVYSITRDFWANDYFQIIHGGIDDDWTTKITSTSFNEEGSTMAYVANTADSFGVSDLGTYTVTLDLRNGRAQVTIEMVELSVTSFDLSIGESSKSYLQYVCAEEGAEEDAARKMVINAYTIPETAVINPADVIISTDPSVSQYVTIEHEVITTQLPDQELPEYSIQITLTLLPAYEEVKDMTTFRLIVEIDNGFTTLENPTDNITITILPNGVVYAPVETVTFTNPEGYLVNVNNGATEWISSTPIEAVVNTDASVQGVVYSELSDHIYIEYRDIDPSEEVVDLRPFVHADALGTYKIYATSLGANKDGETVTAETTVLVTSLIETESEEETTYSTGFYLIGVLDGEEVENWTSIIPEKQNFEGSDFANWTLPVVAGSNNKVYSNTFNLREHDRFSIAFLGMDGNWGGIINNHYMNWGESTGSTYWENGINIEMSENGRYTITLNLSGEGPSFTIERIGDYNPDVAYRMWLYIVRSGDAWDGAVSEEANVILRVGYIDILNGKAQTGLELTSEAFDFYQFYMDNHEGVWPTIQFVTAIDWDYPTTEENNYGIIGGVFQSATWYGEVHQGVTFSGDAYIAAADVKEGDENYFTNYRSQLYWVGEGENHDEIPATQEGQMTVVFKFTFDEGGVLTNVALNFVKTSEVPAE